VHNHKPGRKWNSRFAPAACGVRLFLPILFTGGQTLLNGEEDAGSLAFAQNAHDVIRGSESSICSCASITLVQQLVRTAAEVQPFSGWRYRINDSFGQRTAFAKRQCYNCVTTPRGLI